MVRTGVSCAGGSETVKRISLKGRRASLAPKEGGRHSERGDNDLSRVRKVPTKVKDRVLVAVDWCLIK